MKDTLKDALTTFITSLPPLPTLIFVAGLLLFIVGAAGGIKHDDWLVLTQQAGTIVSTAGGLLVIIGLLIFLFRKDSPNVPIAKNYAVEIIHPQKNQSVDKVDMYGDIKRLPPVGYKLYVLRFYPDGTFYPMREVVIDPATRKWTAPECEIGVGSPRDFAVYLVGPGGMALITYYKDAAKVHNALLKKLATANWGNEEYLPLIKQQTPDMIELARVSVRRI